MPVCATTCEGKDGFGHTLRGGNSSAQCQSCVSRYLIAISATYPVYFRSEKTVDIAAGLKRGTTRHRRPPDRGDALTVGTIKDRHSDPYGYGAASFGAFPETAGL